MRDTKNKTFFLLLILLFFVVIILISLFLWAFGMQGSLSSSAYNLPVKVFEMQNNPDAFHILKISHSQSVSHPQHIALSEKISFEIKKNSINIIPEIYPGNELGNPMSQYQAVSRGTIEMAIISTDVLWNIPEFSLFSIPYMFNSYDELEQFMVHPEVKNSIGLYLRADNIRYMGWGFNSFLQIFELEKPGSDNKIVSLSHTSRYLEWFFQNANIGVHKDERLSLLSSVTGQPNRYAEISSDNLNYSDKFLNLENLFFRNYLLQPCLYLISDSFWNELSPHERVVLQKAVDESISYERELVRQREMNYQVSLSEHFKNSSEGFSPSPNVLEIWKNDNPGLFLDLVK